MGLLEADICIDLLRGHLPAEEWLAKQTEKLGIPGMVALELMVGIRDKNDAKRVRIFLDGFDIVWPAQADMERALRDYGPLALPHGIGAADMLIAATATGSNATLYTFNIKHFRAVPNLVIEQPYTR